MLRLSASGDGGVPSGGDVPALQIASARSWRPEQIGAVDRRARKTGTRNVDVLATPQDLASHYFLLPRPESASATPMSAAVRMICRGARFGAVFAISDTN